MIGRDRELGLADELLAQAERRFGVVLLEGEAGIGKTTVWRELVRRAEERGRRVLACRPAETEAKLGFSAVADLLEAVPDASLRTLPGPARRAIEVALLRVEPGKEQLEERWVAAALRALLATLAAEDPLIVAIDDVQWLDGASAMALGFALRRLTKSPIGWLVSLRSGEPSRLAAERLVDADSLARVTVGPLTPAALHHVLREHTQRPLTRAAMTRIHAASAGNPLWAVEIVRELDRAGAAQPASWLPVPDDLRTLIAARARRLPKQTREALLACAALSEPTISLVEEAALAPAEEEGLVRVDGDGRIAFSHPLYPAAVYASAARSRRRALHRGLAARVSDPEERARHLALASDEPDEAAAAALEEGAVRARSRGSWASAGELLERAAQLTPADLAAKAQRRAVDAAEHHARAGDRLRARVLLEAALAEPMTDRLRAETLRVLGEISYNDRSFSEAERLFAQALAHADEPGRAAAIELQLAFLHGDGADYPGCLEHARRALHLAEAGGDTELIAEALATCAITDFTLGLGVDWATVERALALEDRDRATTLQGRPSTLAGMLETFTDRFPEARQRLTEICEWARERGDEGELAHNLCWRSFLETRNGRLTAAAELADEALATSELTGSPLWHTFARAQSAFALSHLGRTDETRQACRDADRGARESEQAIVFIWVTASLALLELSLGDAKAALAACEPLVAALEDHGIAEPVTAFFLPEALESMIAVGELDRAEALLGAYERRGRELDRPWVLATAARCRALLLAARGDVDAAAGAINQALQDHKRVDMPFAEARTRLVAGRIARRQRRRRDAKQDFEKALATFERLDARLWAQRAQAELDRVGVRKAAGDGLTASEQRVAELVARGLTNRQVAQQLFVSPKTVEATLSRVYRKLAIRSRAELGAWMASDAQK